MTALKRLAFIASLIAIPCPVLANCSHIFADGFEAGALCEWGSGCGNVPLRVIEAAASDEFQVVICFNHPIDSTTLAGDGSQFTFDSGLVSTSASWASRNIVVDTTLQSPGTLYTVTVAASLTDDFGSPPVAGGNTAQFSGFAP